ncbi:2-succinyl-6-hydroxy-2,4-cyclohexadiene-1-carboxylate synthase [Paenisporosarcina quisquiliarum]|uniref:2-succinyl-6-hydroxy-2, 4-cyclohexadiene-1-carboxylate synthase n=1 Tax=Paenisporosarcina quisquiliarum TaxID=365346 RepID=UPI003734DF60
MEQLTVDVRGIQISFTMTNPDANESIVFLHGFTGSWRSWEPVIKLLPKTINYISIDLMGHGSTEVSSNPERYRMNEQLLDLEEFFSLIQLTSFSLVGYSMGGRIALAYALGHPQQVKNLVLESTSPGLKTNEEQQLRRQADDQLADRIEEDGLESFIDFWENIPLFESQKSLSIEKQHEIRSERLAQSALGLANSLRGMGTGQQPSYWSKLDELDIPVYLVTGEYDTKYTEIADEMVKKLKDGSHLQVSSVGHAIHVENPVQFATIIMEQLIDGN